jgi:hypothetical protein
VRDVAKVLSEKQDSDNDDISCQVSWNMRTFTSGRVFFFCSDPTRLEGRAVAAGSSGKEACVFVSATDWQKIPLGSVDEVVIKWIFVSATDWQDIIWQT